MKIARRLSHPIVVISVVLLQQAWAHDDMAIVPGAMSSARPLNLGQHRWPATSLAHPYPLAVSAPTGTPDDVPLLGPSRIGLAQPVDTASALPPPEPAWQLFAPRMAAKRKRKRVAKPPGAAPRPRQRLDAEEVRRRKKESQRRWLEAVNADPGRKARLEARQREYERERRTRDEEQWRESRSRAVRAWRARMLASDPDYFRRRQRAYDNDPVHRARKRQRAKERYAATRKMSSGAETKSNSQNAEI